MMWPEYTSLASTAHHDWQVRHESCTWWSALLAAGAADGEAWWGWVGLAMRWGARAFELICVDGV